MKSTRLMLLVVLHVLAVPASAQVVCDTPRGIAVAHDGVVDLFRSAGSARTWQSEGLRNPTRCVADGERVAFVDTVSNTVRLIDLATGVGETVKVGESPVVALFLNGDLYVLARDARTLERIRRNGPRTALAVTADPAMMRATASSLFVYGRVAGLIQEIDPLGLTVKREASLAPFAADMEIDGKDAYFVYPREGVIRALSLDTFKPSGEWKVGAVPVDLEFAGGGSALTARLIAVADPSAKRVWMVEGSQGGIAAFSRGFLRGILGLGLFGRRRSAFATGIDRIMIRGKYWIAFDTSSGTLYRFTRKGSSELAKGVLPQAFTVTGEGPVWWAGGTLVAKRSLSDG
ncbi:MAG TPA: hypothetical protein VFL80_04885 [Thermoanaerobaculia bacterium]|nr:hypothetical protein [Thermoanaerobaculia bacterium]